MHIALISTDDPADDEIVGCLLVRAMSSPAKFGRRTVEESCIALPAHRPHAAVIDPYLSAEVLAGSGWGSHPRWGRGRHDARDAGQGVSRSHQKARGSVVIYIEHKADGEDADRGLRVVVESSDAPPVLGILAPGARVGFNLERNFKTLLVRIATRTEFWERR